MERQLIASLGFLLASGLTACSAGPNLQGTPASGGASSGAHAGESGTGTGGKGGAAQTGAAGSPDAGATGGTGGKAVGSAGGGGAGGAAGTAGVDSGLPPVVASTTVSFTVDAGVTQVFYPNALAAGSDGTLWYTRSTYDFIGHVAADGAITQYPISDSGGPLILGPDRNIWCAEQQHVARITPSGVLTEYPLPQVTEGHDLNSITLGPDGNFWWADVSRFVGYTTPAGQTTQFPTSTQAFYATVGPEGNIWFIMHEGVQTTCTLESIDLTGAVVKQLPFTCAATTNFTSMALGSDGNFWLTVFDTLEGSTFADTGYVVRVTTAGVVTPFPLPLDAKQSANLPLGIFSGPDGNLWFAESGSSNVVSMRVDGTLTEHPTDFAVLGTLVRLDPSAIALARDGMTLWFAGTSALGSFSIYPPFGPRAGDAGAD